MPTKKTPTSGPGVVVNVSGSTLLVPALSWLCDPPRGENVEPKEEVAVADVAGFDSINWKVKAV